MADEDTGTATADVAAAEAAFGGGFPDTEPKTTTDKAKPADASPAKRPDPAATPPEDPAPVEHVQVTRKEWEEVRAAAARTASYDSQFSKAFGTLGQIQKILNDQKTQTPAQTAAAVRKIDIPASAFQEMSRDFPELATQVQAAMQAALSGIPLGASDADPAELERRLSEYHAKREVKLLASEFPNWREDVGAVGLDEQPDPNHPFRKWLSGKPADYQVRVNEAESADIIGRAIRLFRRETTASAKPTATRDTARAERIAAAVQPRGDRAGAAPANTAEDAFASGYGR
jgi:hypothetical protein